MLVVNGLVILRGLFVDYNEWVVFGLDGWGWDDVVDIFIVVEIDFDFGFLLIYGNDGLLIVCCWCRDEMSCV